VNTDIKTWDREQLAQAVDFWWKLVGSTPPLTKESLSDMMLLWLKHHRGVPGVHSDYAGQFVDGVAK
jgi:hypothetical protein